MYVFGYGVAKKEILEDLKQLDESKKVVIPKFVAEWIELCKGLECTLYCSATSKLRDTMHIEKAKEVSDWLDTFENHELFARAWLDGYEVKKEPLYYVKFDILYLQKYLVKNVETNQFYLSNNEKVVGNYEQVRFTEQEIKVLDERCWPFAVKVDGE
ncbi:DUF1642 domain-containing protein [Enterococcus sp. AZ029]|uniref:DUF1642 domain-containing protein n=1 Tax=Enterococcus sp. AZ029 TaxID=2774841 RepID=UPI003F68D1E4